MGVALPLPTAAAEGAPPAQAGSRVTHYAFLSTGPSGGGRLADLYWGVNRRMHEVLQEYGYPDEAIYRFSELGISAGPGVDGRATLANFRKTFAHLAKVLQPDDHIVIMLVGHGLPSGGDFVHTLADGNLSGSELRELVNRLPARDITVILHPCYSGGFLPKVSGPGRVVVTSTNDAEVNAVPWAEALIERLSLKNPGDPPSIRDAYHAALEPGRTRYGKELKEHPLLDDNGDSRGHFVGEAEAAGGDGLLAARRRLGDDGRRLRFTAEAVRSLNALNAALSFYDPENLRRAFVREAEYLGRSNSGSTGLVGPPWGTDPAKWAEQETPRTLVEALARVYGEHFDRALRASRPAADTLFAETSARLAAYGYGLGDPGANLTQSEPHLRWARRQSDAGLRQALLDKVRTFLQAAGDRR